LDEYNNNIDPAWLLKIIKDKQGCASSHNNLCNSMTLDPDGYDVDSGEFC